MRRIHVNEILFHSIDPKLVNFLSSKRKKHASSESVSPSDTTEAMETEQCKQIKEKVPKGGMTFTAIVEVEIWSRSTLVCFGANVTEYRFYKPALYFVMKHFSSL